MVTIAIVLYVVGSYAACGWFVHSQLDGLLKLVGWLLWLASPFLFPVLALKAFLGVLARGI